MPGRRQQGEGAVYQRARGKQWVAVADLGRHGGKRDRREFTGKTPTEALDKRTRFLDRRRDGFTMPRGRQPYVSEWMLHWLHNIARREVEATTWERSYRQKVTDLICPWFERVPLPELTEEDIEDWHRHLESTVSKRTGRPLSASTIGQAHRIMSRALKLAVVRGKLPRNPCSNVTPPQPGETGFEPPTAAEVKQVLAACRDWPNGARWVLAVTTGLRQGEALALEWRDVYLTGADPYVSVSWSLAQHPWQHGCDDPASCAASHRTHRRPCPPKDCPKVRTSGRRHVCIKSGDPRLCPEDCTGHARACPQRTGGQQLKRPKSKASWRTVPLADAAVEALRAHHKRAMRELGNDYVFQGSPGRRAAQSTDWRDWSALLDHLGLPHYRIHDLRHGYATMLLEAGTDPRVVQAMMGWSTAAMLTRYQHVRPVMHRAVADAVNRTLRG